MNSSTTEGVLLDVELTNKKKSQDEKSEIKSPVYHSEKVENENG